VNIRGNSMIALRLASLILPPACVPSRCPVSCAALGTEPKATMPRSLKSADTLNATGIIGRTFPLKPAMSQRAPRQIAIEIGAHVLGKRQMKPQIAQRPELQAFEFQRALGDAAARPRRASSAKNPSVADAGRRW
jgi:hypothetical protein